MFKNFQFDPILVFSVYKCSRISLFGIGYLTAKIVKIVLKVVLYPSSSHCYCLKNVPPFIFLDCYLLFRDPFSSQSCKQVYLRPLIVSRSQISTSGSHGTLTALFFVQHCFDFKYSTTEAICLENINVYKLKYSNAMHQGKT